MSRWRPASSPPFSLSPRLLQVVFLVLAISAVLLFAFFLTPSSYPVYSVDSITHCVDLDRSSYALTPSIFADLPPAPKCFSSIVSAYTARTFTDINFFDSSYYLQPEFYPNFVSFGLSEWKIPQYTHYGAIGFGSHPRQSVVSVHNFSPPQSFPFFIYSGFGVRSLQRVTLVARLENPSDANFISFSLDDVSRTGFLLGPTFPKFSSDWSHQSILTVSSLASFPPHSISILVYTTRSRDDFSDARASQIPYFDSTDYIGEREVFRLILSPSS